MARKRRERAHERQTRQSLIRFDAQAAAQAADQAADGAVVTSQQIAVAEQIESAFAFVRPGERTWQEAECLESFEATPEQKLEFRKLDPETDWKAIPADTFDGGGFVSMSFLDPAGWRFYLPALMVFSLFHTETSDSMNVDIAVWTLNPYLDDPSLAQHQQTRFALLDAAQVAAVCAFLQWVAAQTYDLENARDAQRYLDTYWTARRDGV